MESHIGAVLTPGTPADKKNLPKIGPRTIEMAALTCGGCVATLNPMPIRSLIIFVLSSTMLWASDPLEAKAKVVALVFMASECPISNRIAPEIERLHHKFPTNEVAVCIIYPNHSDSEEMIRKHRAEYRLSAPFWKDPKRELVRKAGVSVTPEAAVFNAKRELVYRGRITDQFLALGRARLEPSQHDLEEAIEATLAGKKPKEARTKAVGCYIEDR